MLISGLINYYQGVVYKVGDIVEYTHLKEDFHAIVKILEIQNYYKWKVQVLMCRNNTSERGWNFKPGDIEVWGSKESQNDWRSPWEIKLIKENGN